MTYRTSTEKYFEKLRRLMLQSGYDRSHAALQSLARLRKALRQSGYTFEQVQEASNG
jgi:hypothetical protein